MPDDDYQPPPIPDDATITVVRAFHMLDVKGEDGVVLRVVGLDGSQHFFAIGQVEYFANVVDVWNTSLKAVLAARNSADTAGPTWQQLTMEMAMMLLPLDAAEREVKVRQISLSYVKSLTLAGHSEEVIVANLNNMLARLAEYVVALEASGGKIGTA